jgi:hypothetical protein
MVDMTGSFHGWPVPPWPAAAPGQPFPPPAGKGIARLLSNASSGRCPGAAGRSRAAATAA